MVAAAAGAARCHRSPRLLLRVPLATALALAFGLRHHLLDGRRLAKVVALPAPRALRHKVERARLALLPPLARQLHPRVVVLVGRDVWRRLHEGVHGGGGPLVGIDHEGRLLPRRALNHLALLVEQPALGIQAHRLHRRPRWSLPPWQAAHQAAHLGVDGLLDLGSPLRLGQRVPGQLLGRRCTRLDAAQVGQAAGPWGLSRRAARRRVPPVTAWRLRRLLTVLLVLALVALTVRVSHVRALRYLSSQLSSSVPRAIVCKQRWRVRISG